MKRAFLLPAFVAAALIAAVVPTAFAQEEDSAPAIHVYTKTIPLAAAGAAHTGKSFKASPAVAGSGSAIPMWNYSLTSSTDSHSYSGTMVGSSPYFNGARTTNIPTVIVPIVVVLSDGSVYDPTANDKCAGNNSAVNLVTGSPIFQPYDFTINGINMGSGQYIDEFQRANFYDNGPNVAETGNSYHTILTNANGAPGATVLSPVTINMPANLGESWNRYTCSPIAVIDYATFTSDVTNNLLPSLASEGFGASTFVVFLVHDVVMAEPGDSLNSNCCVVGLHGALQANSGAPVQTYAIADYDTSGVIGQTGIETLSQEVGDWMDNPLGTNLTPSWGDTGDVSTCVNYLSVSDPIFGWPFSPSGVTMPNGVTYNPQQLAFFSWFYGISPSLGAGGGYSDGITLSVPAHLCDES
jgi:hypothetical protein